MFAVAPPPRAIATLEQVAIRAAEQQLPPKKKLLAILERLASSQPRQ